MPLPETDLPKLDDVIDQYENRWLALFVKDGVDLVAGVGGDAVEALFSASEKGFDDVVLFKVPRFDLSVVTFQT